MKKRFFIAFGVIFFLALGIVGLRHSMATQQEVKAAAVDSNAYVPNEVLVKFKVSASNATVTAGIKAISGQIMTHRGKTISSAEWTGVKNVENRSFIGDPSLFHIKVPSSIGEKKAIEQLLTNPNVEYAERNAIYTAAVLPNDTYFSQQWALNNTGQTGGTNDADIDAPAAWNVFTGSPNITVAVIDSGVDYNHYDLLANIWINPVEAGGGRETDGIDNDGNGYIDDWHGWNFAGQASANDPMDNMANTYHGTHVAGIVGASTGNGLGVAGVCWNVKLMAVKALDSGGRGDTASLVRAIDYARVNGADIINASWGSTNYSGSLYNAITRAQSAGILFCAAAGNNSADNDTSPYYPASFDLDNIIAVLSTDHRDALSTFSSYGRYSADLGAPGTNIMSTKRNQAYQSVSGTSMATPFVSGAAALVLGQRPALNWWQIKTMLLKSVDPRPSLSSKCQTAGRLNLYNALTYATPILPAAPTNLTGTATDYGSYDDITLTWTDNSNNESGFNIYMKSGNIYEIVDSVDANVRSYVLEGVASGTYSFYVRAFAVDGESVKTGSITVKAP